MHEEALDLNLIRIDGGTQTRASLDYETVLAYAADMQAGDQFPPIEVYYDGSTYWLADGFHRLEATRQNGGKQIVARVYQGTQRDAVLASASANAKHGLRRTNEDKRRAVLRLLMDEEWGQWSDREIARRCHVSHPFVAKIRGARTGNISSGERVFIHKNGSVTRMNVEQIGSGVGEPAPQPTGNVSSGEVHKTYATIWRLEQYVRAYLPTAAGGPMHFLEKAKREGLAFGWLEDYVISQTGGDAAFRRNDLRQAVNNVLDQLRQDEKRRAEKQTSVVRPAPVNETLTVKPVITALIDELAQHLGLDRMAVIALAIEQLHERECKPEKSVALPTF